MKKGIFVGLGVVSLLVLMWWANKKFPPPQRPTSSTTTAPSGQAPSVAVKDLNDHDVTMAQYKGQVVLVNFWATWCEPCKSEIPLLIGIQHKYRSRGFVILGLSMDEDGKKSVQPFLDKERFDVDGRQSPIDYPIALANDSIAEKFGGVIGLPTSVLYNRDGKEITRVVGPVDLEKISCAIECVL